MGKQMLTMDPTKRPSAQELLNHNVIQKLPTDQTLVQFDSNIATNMKKFRCSTNFKKVVLTMIAQNLKDCDLEQLRQNFIGLDKNKDGTLSKSEVLEGMRKAGVPLPDDFAEVIDGLDTD